VVSGKELTLFTNNWIFAKRIYIWTIHERGSRKSLRVGISVYMKNTLFYGLVCATTLFTTGCYTEQKVEAPKAEAPAFEQPEYFILRPIAEKEFGYSHAVKIGNEIKISGAVSMDSAGVPTAKGDMQQQMKNCYADLDIILKHYGCTFDDVVVENIFTTNMPEFLKQSAYRNSIYKKNFPTGSWTGVKELALPEFMIEIELEVYKAHE
jgi:enamine deaminase RidA (YjgF/YER057c/UK114 family)